MRTSVIVASALFTTGCLFGTRFEDERQVCREMADCLIDAEPALEPALVAEYGDESACWDDRESAERCAEQCDAGRVACENPGGGGDGDTDDDTAFEPPS